jgi:hypothetical protein
MQIARRIDPSSDHGGAAPITLLLVEPQNNESGELYQTLNAIVARYAPMVELQVVDHWPAHLGRYGGREGQPIVVVLRRGQIVGEAMGTLLPARELDRVVRCAVEWPADLPESDAR